MIVFYILMFWCLLTIISLYCVSLMSTDTFATYIAITIPFVVLQFIPKCVWKFIENCANSFSEYIIAPKVVLEKCSMIIRKKYRGSLMTNNAKPCKSATVQ